ncbi:uncharacterized protein LOC122004195 [Zingiber officinale]|uniref:uncharacterized protein LOC122004195 n=1 Tax=Zingiber officinale TaxID=94328 RepID=UPI001C4ACB4F|nr:uncharacterized protein LOC122004195 [Zingiber officinale]
MADSNRTMKELAAPDEAFKYSCITYPTLAGDFELRSGLIHLLPKFQGLSGEDPNRHLHEFHVVCSTMKPQGILEEDIKLRAFPFSLTGVAKVWLYYLPPGYITSWIDMKKAFLEKYFPASRIATIRKSICGIQQVVGETLYEYWERFKKLCASCPQHQISEQLLVQYFYEGLLPIDRSMIDAAAGGALVNKTPEQVRELISNMAENSQQFGSRALTTRGVGEVQMFSNEQKEIRNSLLELTSLVKQLALNNVNQTSTLPSTQFPYQSTGVCVICSSQEHDSELCPNLHQDESLTAFSRAQFSQKYDPYSSTYNPGWRDHPNLKYGFQQPATQFQQQQTLPASSRLSLTHGNSSNTSNSDPQQARLEELMQQILLQQQNQQRTDLAIQNIERSGRRISEFSSEEKAAENFSELQRSNSSSERIQEDQSVPNSSSIPALIDPLDLEHSQRGGSINPENSNSFYPAKLQNSSKAGNSGIQNSIQGNSEPNVSLPFPLRKTQPRKNIEEERAKEFQEHVNLFSKVEVNVPLLTMIKQIPKYARFLKDLCVHKKKLKGNELISLGKNVSALIQPVPQKYEDPGLFTVPCEIGSSLFKDAMLDLGASINVMPKSVFQTLGIGPLLPTGVVIQLADRSQTHPAGVIEDVLVKVRELIFPADFYILDMEGDCLASRSPLILGRPFLKTARTKIDVHAGTLSMEIGDTVV